MLYRNIISFLLILTSGASFAAIVTDVRVWRAPDYTRVVFDLSAPVQHNLITLQNPSRIVVDISGSTFTADTSKLDFSDSPVNKLRSGVKNKSDLRVVLDMSSRVNARSFLLKSNEKKGHRLVIDLYDEKKKKPAVVKRVDFSGRRDIVVAIVAGHGGEDPGASGPNRLREKKVVLAIAKELNYLFSKAQGYNPVMIRKGDYGVGLTQRRKLAHKAQADFMVSIHADAFTDSRVNGASVYVLSRKGASSATAKFLAKEANSSDLVGGVSLNDKEPVLASVLTDLSMSASLDSGFQVGANIIRSLGRVAKLHSNKVQQANFVVLQSPDIPSLLVETGFISNPAEAKKLNTRSYQRKIAKAIYSGISHYFSTSPPPDTYLAWVKKNRQLTVEYTIARGDTLSEIARRFQVSVASIRRQNDLASSMIKIGQRILIPAS